MHLVRLSLYLNILPYNQYYQHFSGGVQSTTLTGLKISAIQMSRTSRVSFWASTFSFSLALWARGQAICLSTKSLKDQTKTCPGQVIFETYLSLKGKLVELTGL